MTATNFKGILNHDGSIRVAEHNVMQEIVFIRGNEVHLRNKKGNKYVAQVHKKLDITFAEVGDIGLVRFNSRKPYLVGFKKELRKRTKMLFVLNPKKEEAYSSFDLFCMKICPYVLFICIFVLMVLGLYIMITHGISLTGTEANQYYNHMSAVIL